MNKDFWLEFKKELLDFLIVLGPHLIYAIISLVVGIFIIKYLMNLLRKILRKSKVESSLRTFVESLSIFLLYGLLLFVIGLSLGIKASSFLAIFGAASIAIGLALQGSLANFAGGLLILVFKPFKVGDLINVNGNLGFVQKIDILYTRIKTYDGLMVTMPNGNVSNSDVDNRTMEPFRRVGLSFSFNFEIDVDEVRDLILETMNKHPKINKDFPVDAWLDGIGEYDLKMIARCWVKSDEFYPVYWEQLEAVKKTLDANGIVFAIPKRAIYQEQLKTREERKPD